MSNMLTDRIDENIQKLTPPSNLISEQDYSIIYVHVEKFDGKTIDVDLTILGRTEKPKFEFLDEYASNGFLFLADYWNAIKKEYIQSDIAPSLKTKAVLEMLSAILSYDKSKDVNKERKIILNDLWELINRFTEQVTEYPKISLPMGTDNINQAQAHIDLNYDDLHEILFSRGEEIQAIHRHHEKDLFNKGIPYKTSFKNLEVEYSDE